MQLKTFGIQNDVIELAFSSGPAYADPFSDVELDVVFTTPSGEERRVPAFWSGDQTWRVRYASAEVGEHTYCTVCSDETNASLHGQEGVVEIAPYEGRNPLLRHGPVQVVDAHHFAHADGAPFFWLGDTWWMGLCNRLHWPDEFQRLTADRVAKGFSVIQIVAGLYPDMPEFDRRGVNEAGFPWESGYARINPAYFDMADLRIQHLVRAGLVPCILGCWGYYVDFVGVEVMKQHWRYILARWGAYPVVWCMAGEATMLWYLSPAKGDKDAMAEAQAQARARWTEVTRYLRESDPFHRPITLHPSQSARDCVDDPTVMDFDMLQTGHGGWDSMANTVRAVNASQAAEPAMPTVVGEVCYEGILGGSWEDVQRFAFWASMLSGAQGFTYGGNGIWQVNRPEQPFGPSPHGRSWGGLPWAEAAALPGSTQLGLAKKLLEHYEYWRFEPHPEWIEPHATEDSVKGPYAAGIPGNVRVFYIPATWGAPTVKGLDAGAQYHAFFFNVRDGDEVDLGVVAGDASGDWRVPTTPIGQDWALVVERR